MRQDATRTQACLPSRLAWLALLGLLWWSSPSASKADIFELHGIMTISPSIPVPPFSCKMHIVYSNCLWSVTQTWESSTNRVISRLSDDGTNVYRLDRVDVNAPDGSWATVPISQVGELHPTGFPVRYFGPEISILFYGYLSACYLNSSSNIFLYPIKFDPTDLAAGDLRVKTRLVRNRDRLGLPTEMSFLSDENNTNAVLTALNFTNVGAVSIPLKVRATRYSNNRKVLVVYDFAASHVYPKCSIDSFTPVLGSRTLISDFRLAHGKAYVPPVTLGYRSNGWPGITETKGARGLKFSQLDWEKIQADAQRARTKPRSQWSIIVIRVSFLLLLISGAVGLVYYLTKVSKHPVKEKTN